jgi:hypothetical protein
MPVNLGEILRSGAVASALYVAPLVLLKRRSPNQEILRSAGALAAFCSCYRFLSAHGKELEAQLVGGNEKTTGTVLELLPSNLKSLLHNVLSRHRTSLAAFLAVCAAIQVDPSFSSSLFVIWCFIKASFPLLIPQDVRPSWLGLAIMTLATSIALPAGYKKPDLHHPAYKTFLHTWVHDLNISLHDFYHPPPGPTMTLSDSIHPGESFFHFVFARAFPSCVKLSFKLYTPLHLTFALLRLIRRFTSERKEKKNASSSSSSSSSSSTSLRYLATQTIENILRSVLFLSGYVTSLWALILLHSKAMPGGTIPKEYYYFTMWIPSLFILFERPDRQVDLGLYVLAHGINSIYRGLVIRGSVTPSVPGGMGLLALSAAFAFSQMSGRNGGLMNVLFGNDHLPLSSENEKKESSHDG